MKRLSDYKGDDSLKLWADILEDVSTIMEDEKVQAAWLNKPIIGIASTIMSTHPKEIKSILLRIDKSPLDGLNIIKRLVVLLNEVQEDPELEAFFGLQSQSEIVESSGSATENTKAKGK